MGQLVVTPLDGTLKAGDYLLEYNGNGLSQGIYQYTLRLDTGTDVMTTSRKMILNK